MNTEESDTTAYECIHTRGLDDSQIPPTIFDSSNFNYAFMDFYTSYVSMSEYVERIENIVVTQEAI